MNRKNNISEPIKVNLIFNTDLKYRISTDYGLLCSVSIVNHYKVQEIYIDAFKTHKKLANVTANECLRLVILAELK